MHEKIIITRLLNYYKIIRKPNNYMQHNYQTRKHRLMNFKNLILTTILLSNIPTTFCVEDISLTDFLSNEPKASELADTKHAKYLLDRKIPIYSGLPKHEHLVDKQ